MKRLSYWLGLLLVLALGATIWTGISLRAATQERERLAGTIRQLQTAATVRDNELTLMRQTSERAKTDSMASADQLMAAQHQWEQIVSPKKPSAPVWAPLAQATGLTWHDPLRKDEMWPDRVAWAVRFLSETVLLGPADLPPTGEVDYRVIFTGVADGEVLVAHDVVYFRGKAYYRPGFSGWFGTNMHAN